MITADTDQLRVAEIYERFQEHIKLRGQCSKNDKQIWQWVDDMTEQTAMDLLIFASDSPHWNTELSAWFSEVADRCPFHVRTAADKNRTTDNNTMTWKLLMLAREVIEARLREAQDPRRTLFDYTGK